MKERKIIRISVIALISFLMITCGNNKKPRHNTRVEENKNTYEKIKGLRWILGRWQNDSEQGLFIERWIITNDSVYTGKSVCIGSGKDTIFSETITIEQRGNDVFYIPVVKEENDGKPTLFKLTLISSKPTILGSIPVVIKSVTFENPEHDFPQKIMYQLIEDSLLAEISGTIEGKNHTEKFPMVRAK